MTAHQNTDRGTRDYVLAELRCAAVKAKLAQFDIESVAVALSYNIITAEQAVAMLWDCESIHFLGLELNGGAA